MKELKVGDKIKGMYQNLHVNVWADTPEEDNWKEGEFILDSDCYFGNPSYGYSEDGDRYLIVDNVGHDGWGSILIIKTDTIEVIGKEDTTIPNRGVVKW